MIKKICIIVLILLCSCKHKKSEEKLKDRDSIMSEYIKMGKARWIYDYWDPNINDGNVPDINHFWKETTKTSTQDSVNKYWKEIIRKDSLNKIFTADFIKSPTLKDKTISFLVAGNNSKFLINQEYCNTISEYERAALGYVALLNGTMNTYYDKTTNKECTMRSALNLDNEFSDKYKNYMLFWFRNDERSLKDLKNCSPISASYKGASIYYYFQQIILKVNGNKISIFFKAEYLNRDRSSTWNEKIVFLVDKDNLKILEVEKS